MKAILLLDEMPVRCIDCPCMYSVKNPDMREYCKAIVDKGFLRRIENICERPSWCPLKTMPEKKQVDEKYVSDITYALSCLGYNKCIDELTGE